MSDFLQSILDEASDFFGSVFYHTGPVPLPEGHVTVQVLQPPVSGSTPVAAPIPVHLPPASPDVHTGPLPAVHATPQTVVAPAGSWTLDAITASIAQNEGGYVNNPNDSGHETNHGITLAFAKLHPDYFDLDHDGVVSVADIKAMPVAVAQRAYIDLLFTPVGLMKVTNASNILVQVCDMSMNGPNQAIKTLQHAVSVKVTGHLDQGTLDALNAQIKSLGANVVNNNIVVARLHFYDQVVAAHPQDHVFLVGWDRRANKYKA